MTAGLSDLVIVGYREGLVDVGIAEQKLRLVRKQAREVEEASRSCSRQILVTPVSHLM